MKLLQEATRKTLGIASPRGLMILLATLAAFIVPTAAFASEKDVKLNFSAADKNMLYVSLAMGLLAIVFAFVLRSGIIKKSPGSEKMQAVGLAIRQGALAYLQQQVKLMAIFVVVLGVGLFFLFDKNAFIPITFLLGVCASYFAGYAGMLTAVDGNMRTANAALTSYKSALEIAFRSGAVAGMVTVGLGLLGATLILLFGGAQSMLLLVGFGFGGSLAALFMRVGGGIFTKAADVGADLVGKVEAGIPEDDPRNPATIADNVGDNVGDCAGMAADVFESYEVTLVAAIVLGAATAAIFDETTWMRLILFALMARGVGIVASIVGIYSVKGSDDINADPLKKIRVGFYASAGVALAFTAVLAFFMMGGTGTPVTTSRLESIDAVKLPKYEQIRTVADELKKKDPKLGQFPVEELQKDQRIKDMGLGGRDGVQVLQTALSVDANLITTAKPLKGFSPVKLDDPNDPIAKYSTVIPPSKPGDKLKFLALSEAYKEGELKYFKLKITQGAAAPAAPTPDNVQEVYVGPTTDKMLDEQIKGASTVKVEKIGSYPASLYYSKEKDELLVAVDSSVPNPLTITPPNLTLWKEGPKELDAAYNLAQGQQNPNAPRPLTGIKLALNNAVVVPWYMFFFAIAFGLLMAFLIEWLTDYYVSTHKKPVQEIAGVSSAGAAPMIIQGFAYAAESSVFMVFGIVIALIAPLFFFPPATYGSYILSFYGVALVGLGLLTTTGYVLAMDTFGPISDNAQGVYEMSGEGHDNEYGSKAVQRLDAAGNTTKALTKGFAIATAVVAAVALFHSYLEDAQLGTIGLRLDLPEIFLGLLIGASAPYLFASSTINAVGRAAVQLINEVRRQFRNDPGIMAGTSKPDYAACVAIVTSAAQKELLGPGILAIAMPVAVAFGFSIGKAPVMVNGELYNLTGAQALGGFLAGAIVSGQLMAVLLANSGGMWDNAKKLVEDGLFGGKGSEAHKAAIVCDTVGDPFKDTAGPAMNPLIKVMNLVALLIAPIVIRPYGTLTLVWITLVAVGLLTFAIVMSKKGSLSSAMAQAANEPGSTGPGAPAAIAEAKPQQRITVGDEEEEGEKV